MSNVTTAQIEALRTEAAEAGDNAQVDLCDLALDGDKEALAACAKALGIQTRIQLGWDSQDADNEGWFAEVQTYTNASGEWEYSDDSLKIWFPVSVDEFGRDQKTELKEALLEAYPGAKIV